MFLQVASCSDVGSMTLAHQALRSLRSQVGGPLDVGVRPRLRKGSQPLFASPAMGSRVSLRDSCLISNTRLDTSLPVPLAALADTGGKGASPPVLSSGSQHFSKLMCKGVTGESCENAVRFWVLMSSLPSDVEATGSRTTDRSPH